MGLMHKLLERSEKHAGKEAIHLLSVSVFHPVLPAQRAQEIISDKISYEIKDYQLPKNRQVPGSVRRVKTDGEELKETYAIFAQHTHGAVIRDELAWNEYWLWDKDDIMAAIYYNEKEEPDGYIIFRKP